MKFNLLSKLVSGWSDKVFEVLAALENGGSALDAVNDIEL